MAALSGRDINNQPRRYRSGFEPVRNVGTDLFEVTNGTGVQRDRRRIQREFDRQVFSRSVHGDQFVLFLEQKLGQIVGQVFRHVGVDDQDVGPTQSGYRIAV